MEEQYEKKFLMAVMAAAVFGLAGCQGSAQTDGPAATDASAFEYEQKDDGTIKITGLKDGSLKVLVIPEKIEGKSVTEIGEYAFSGCNSLKTIHTPAGSYAEKWAKENGYAVEN